MNTTDPPMVNPITGQVATSVDAATGIPNWSGSVAQPVVDPVTGKLNVTVPQEPYTFGEVQNGLGTEICNLSHDGVLTYHGDAEEALSKMVAMLAQREVKAVVRVESE